MLMQFTVFSPYYNKNWAETLSEMTTWVIKYEIYQNPSKP